MRVTIEHNEQSAGVTGNKRNYFVNCLIEFSEEERAIIKARSLYDHQIVVDGAEPPRSKANFIGAGFLKAGAPFVAIAGLIAGLFHGGQIADLLFVGGIGMFVGGFVMDRRPPGDSKQQIITIRRLIGNPRILIYAADPAVANVIENELGEQLAYLKTLITGSAEVRGRHSYEL